MKLNIVPASTGALWVKQGAKTFVRQPVALTGLFLMFVLDVTVRKSSGMRLVNVR